jgi:ATP-binding cassette subfamily C (CFTR/MRP) protein 3
MAVGGIQAARLLHEALLHNKMRSPQSFFDTTPSGRILNRFSKDIYVIDEVLAPTILMLFNSFYNSISTVVVIVVSTPLFIVVILPLAVFYAFVQVPAPVGRVLMLKLWCGWGVQWAGLWCGPGIPAH